METHFSDDVNPICDELRRWAYTDAPEPMEDFDIIIADVEFIPALLELVGDATCPKRRYLLGSLYCLVGHTALDDSRIAHAAAQATISTDPWLAAWGRRTASLLQEPLSRNREDWCGWRGYRTRPEGD